MKQEIPATESNGSSRRHSPAPAAARARASRTRDGAGVGSPPDGVKANDGSRIRRSIFPDTPREREAEEPRIAGQPRGRAVERHARERRQQVDADRRGSESRSDGRAKDDLGRRLGASESVVRELRSEVSALEAQIERLKCRNVLLESQNKRLERDLSSAEAKIKALERPDQVQTATDEIKPSEFKDARQRVANKSDLAVNVEVSKGDKVPKLQYLEEIRPRVQPTVPPPPPRTPPVAGPPPPPPPPPPRSAPSRANATRKAPSLVELYRSMTKTNERKGNFGSENCASPVANKAHNSIVDELQNRSAHLLAIKADVEKKGDFVNHLVRKIQSAAFSDIEDVLTFVDWLDGQLSTLADERAVLKHFNWPEGKADALREAAFEYRDLKRLLAEVSSFEDDVSLSTEATLKKITNLLEKSERSVDRLIRLRDASMPCYKDSKIPIGWMFDSGMVSKIKQATAKLAKLYIKRVSAELESARRAERESTQEALLLQGVHFAYRAYQFGGGLDAETMHAFEEFRARVQSHRRGSRDSHPLTQRQRI